MADLMTELRALEQKWRKYSHGPFVDDKQQRGRLQALDCANQLAEILARHEAQGEAVAFAWYTDWPGFRAYAAAPHGWNEPHLILNDPAYMAEVWHPLYLHPAPNSKRVASAVTDEMAKAAWRAYASGDEGGPAGMRAALTAALAAKEADGWLDIESAPRDGEFLGAYDDGSMHVIDGRDWPGYTFRPTHWRPLPAAPVADKAKEG